MRTVMTVVWMVMIAVLVLAVLLLRRGSEGFDEQVGIAIAHGTSAPRGRYPWFCSMEVKDGTGWLQVCGGVLVSPNVVLTAAHCPLLIPELGGEQRVAVGRYSVATNQGVQVRRVKRVVYYQRGLTPSMMGTPSPSFKDVALLVLDRPCKGPFASIAPSKYRLPKRVTALGFGMMNEAGEQPRILQEVDLDVVACKNKIGKHLICAVNTKTQGSACPGDSGGPLLVKGARGEDMVVGVTSGGSDNKRCGQGPIGAWADLRKYAKWIQAQLKVLRTRTPPPSVNW